MRRLLPKDEHDGESVRRADSLRIKGMLRSVFLLGLLFSVFLFVCSRRTPADEVCITNHDTDVVKSLDLERYKAFMRSGMKDKASESLECNADKGVTVLVKDDFGFPDKYWVIVEVQENRSAFEKWLKQLVPYCSGWMMRERITCPQIRTPTSH